MEIEKALERLESQTRNIHAWRKKRGDAAKDVIFRLFIKWLGNWRSLVSSGNKSALILMTRSYIQSLPEHPNAYGSTERKNKYFAWLRDYLLVLEDWTPKEET